MSRLFLVIILLVCCGCSRLSFFDYNTKEAANDALEPEFAKVSGDITEGRFLEANRRLDVLHNWAETIPGLRTRSAYLYWIDDVWRDIVADDQKQSVMKLPKPPSTDVAKEIR